MDVKEILRFADDLVFAKTGKHLDNVQEAILQGAWQGKTYTKIAEESGYTDGHVRDIASKLWQLLSEILGENIKKSNFHSTIERYQISHASNFVNINFIEKSHINVCTETLHPPKTPQNSSPTETSTENNTQEKPRFDLKDAPDIKTFYNCTSQLLNLENAITHENSQLLTITGMSGIGKSAMIRQLIPQIQTQFDAIIWRSLRTSPPLETTLKNLIQSLSNHHHSNSSAMIGEGDILSGSTDELLAIFIDLLRDNPCLIILDDAQQILKSGQLSGHYKPGYENYGTLFKLIGEVSHQSRIILNSWEPPLDVMTFTADHSSVRLLQLTGLGETATEILRDQGLFDEETWSELINLYQGNPLWLKLVSQTINDLFSGKVSEYLKEQPLFLSDELTSILQQHYQRLSECEKQAITLLSHHTKSITVTPLLQTYQGLRTDLLKAIQSLVRRGFVEKISEGRESRFLLNPIWQQFNSR